MHDDVSSRAGIPPDLIDRTMFVEEAGSNDASLLEGLTDLPLVEASIIFCL